MSIITNRRYAAALLVSALALLATALPAHAEFVWNPFDHMTPDEAQDTLFLTLLLLFFGFLGLPLLLGALAYWVLRNKYPLVPAKLKTVLLYTYGAYWVGNLASGLMPTFPWPSLLHTLFLWLSLAVSLGITVGGAVVGYFRKPRQV